MQGSPQSNRKPTTESRLERFQRLAHNVRMSLAADRIARAVSVLAHPFVMIDLKVNETSECNYRQRSDSGAFLKSSHKGSVSAPLNL